MNKMFNRDKMPKAKKTAAPVIERDPAIHDGAMIDTDFQKALSKKRSRSELARAKTINNVLLFALAFCLFITLIAVGGWRKAADRYANNVQLLYVKLAPDGTSQVDYFGDGGAGNRWYEATVNASLINYVEHRFQKHKATISYDYGFALQYMSPAISADFRDNYGAADVALEHTDCIGCPATDVHIRAIDHETLQYPTNQQDISTAVYKTVVYITLTEREEDGNVLSKENKIVNLTWRLLPAPDVAANPNALNANPLGISIINQKVKNDLSVAN